MSAPPPHDDGDGHDHHHAPADPADLEMLWKLDNVELTTVGMDVGSSTSHLMIAKVRLQRQGVDLSSRFVPVERTVLYRSEIRLTPYVAGRDDLIDVDVLAELADTAHRAAGVAPEDVDTGVVILTGLALERANSRAIAELFAEREGAFVCATAGHRFEAILAAHGSGAVDRSRELDDVVVNIDIGGGTTKISQTQSGRVVHSMAIAVGARLVVIDDEGNVAAVDPSLEVFARDLGIDVVVGAPLPEADRVALAQCMVDAIVAAALPHRRLALDDRVILEGELDAALEPVQTVFSGGVSEFIHGREPRDFGDLGQNLAQAIRSREGEFPVVDEAATIGIRATVVGASQHSVALSGNTIHVSSDALLPMRNLPVVRVVLGESDLDLSSVRAAIDDAVALRGLEADGAAALMISWTGPPAYTNLRALAEAVTSSVYGTAMLAAHHGIVVALDHDVAGLVGRILGEELGIEHAIVVDGLDLTELDFIDLGRRQQPANVVPAIIKSLLFG